MSTASGKRMTIGLRVDEPGPAHVVVTVFMGPEGARGNCGTLRLRPDEWRHLRDGFLLAQRTAGEVTLSGRWEEVPE